MQVYRLQTTKYATLRVREDVMCLLEKENFSELDLEFGGVFHVGEEVLPLFLDDVTVVGGTAVSDAFLGGAERHEDADEQNSQHLPMTVRTADTNA